MTCDNFLFQSICEEIDPAQPRKGQKWHNWAHNFKEKVKFDKILASYKHFKKMNQKSTNFMSGIGQ